MNINRRTLLKTAILAFKPPILNIDKRSMSLPKFDIGDYVEFVWHEDGCREYERGYICGITLPDYSQRPSQTEWEYHLCIEDSSYKPCIGLMVEYPESWLRTIQNPKRFGFSHPLTTIEKVLSSLVKT